MNHLRHGFAAVLLKAGECGCEGVENDQGRPLAFDLDQQFLEAVVGADADAPDNEEIFSLPMLFL